MGENSPKVPIELDKPRNLQFTFGVAKRFKEQTGIAIAEGAEELDFDQLSILMYLMLRVEDKELTQEEADDLFHVADIEEYGEKIRLLMPQSMVEVEGGEGPKVEPLQENPTGLTPGPLQESVLE